MNENYEIKVKLTDEQMIAIQKKYILNSDGAKSFDEFLSRVQPEICGPAVMLRWCEMVVGIEPDGYAHT